MDILKDIVSIIFPPFCEICNSRLSTKELYICNFCLRKIKINSPPFCITCSRHLSYKRRLCNECINKKSYLKRVWSWGIYDSTLKKCLHLFKYKKKPYLLNLFKKSIFDFFEKNLIMRSIDIIILVPLHASRLKERTFNQSQIIASTISGHFGITLLTTLKKVKITLPQNKLTKQQRRINVKDIFIVEDKKAIYRKKVLVVDDIFTTGSTLNESARTLLYAGAGKAYGFTLARGL